MRPQVYLLLVAVLLTGSLTKVALGVQILSHSGQTFEQALIDFEDSIHPMVSGIVVNDQVSRDQKAIILRDRLLMPDSIGTPLVMTFSPDGRLLAVCSRNGSVSLWDVESRRLRAFLGKHKKNEARMVVFSPDGRVLATGGYDGNVYLWDVATGKLRTTLSGHRNSVEAISFSPDSTTVATLGSGNKRAFIWNVASGAKIMNMPDSPEPYYPPKPRGILGPLTEVFSLKRDVFDENEFLTNAEISPDGKTLAITSNAAVYLWDILTKLLIRKIGQHGGTIYTSIYSPDGRYIATGSRDWTAKLWNVVTGQLEMTMGGHQERVTALSFSRDGRLLATGSVDRTVRLWDVTTKALVAVLAGHDDDIGAIEFSPGGNKIATASRGKAVKLWDTSDGQLIADLEGARFPITYSPDGRTLATAGENSTVLLWDVAVR